MKNRNSESTQTILTIVVGLIAFYFVFKANYFLFVALVLGTGALVSEKLAWYAHKAWMMLAKILSYIMPNILLSIIYYLFLTPIALLKRLVTNSDFMLPSKNKDSSFIETLKKINQKDFEKPW